MADAAAHGGAKFIADQAGTPLRRAEFSFIGGQRRSRSVADFPDLGQRNKPWKDVHVTQSGERVAPLATKRPQSDTPAGSLLSQVPLPSGQFHAMPVEENDLEAAAGKLCESAPTDCRFAAGVRPRPSRTRNRMAHRIQLVPGDQFLRH